MVFQQLTNARPSPTHIILYMTLCVRRSSGSPCLPNHSAHLRVHAMQDVEYQLSIREVNSQLLEKDFEYVS